MQLPKMGVALAVAAGDAGAGKWDDRSENTINQKLSPSGSL
jgi:hypothetical protein